jgi:hypothetical protein
MSRQASRPEASCVLSKYNCPDQSPWLLTWPSHQVVRNHTLDLSVLQQGPLPKQLADVICSTNCSNRGHLGRLGFFSLGCECNPSLGFLPETTQTSSSIAMLTTPRALCTSAQCWVGF